MENEEEFNESMRRFEASVVMQRQFLKNRGKPFLFLTILVTPPDETMHVDSRSTTTMRCDTYDNISSEYFDDFVRDVFGHILETKNPDITTARIH